MITEFELQQIGYEHLKVREKTIKIFMKAKRKELNTTFKRENKKKLLIIDALFLLFILFNIGALIITNTLVMKEKPVIKEANPITAKTHNLQTTNNLPQYFGILFHILILTFLIGYYTLLKNTIINNQTYTIFLIIIIIIGSTLTYDFLDDTGYLIGKIIFN
jgi:hypothetical protein